MSRTDENARNGSQGGAMEDGSGARGGELVVDRGGRARGEELVAEHGSAKQAEPTDPLHLVGTAVPGGDPDHVARCLIEELASMGHGAAEILAMFRDPGYLALHIFYRRRGEAAVAGLIRRVVAECGVWQVTETVQEPAAPCPKLHQIEQRTKERRIEPSGPRLQGVQPGPDEGRIASPRPRPFRIQPRPRLYRIEPPSQAEEKRR